MSKQTIFLATALLISIFSQAQVQAPILYEDPQPFGGTKGLFSNKETLRSGTLVLLETAERFSSDQVTVGKVIQFRVRTNVMAGKEVAIRSGALAIGRVKAIEPATYNNPAEIRIELQYAQAVDGQTIALNGQEQSLRGQFGGQGTTVETGASITGFVMNDTTIKAD